MSISLPTEMKSVVEARVREGLYADASDYIRELIRADMSEQGDWEIDGDLAAALDAGEASGLSAKSLSEIVAEERAKFGSS